MSEVTIKKPSVLAYAGKLVPSAGMMSFGIKEGGNTNFFAVPVGEKTVRGTISNRLKPAVSGDPLKLNAEIRKSNIQTVDESSLPFNSDTLKVEFSLRVMNDIGKATACNEPVFAKVVSSIVDGYQKEHGFGELAKRYALNIASGRFLWRNRAGAESVKVVVTAAGKTFMFDGYDFDIRDFDVNAQKVKDLADIIESGLSTKPVVLKIEAYCAIGSGQVIYPSEEFVKGEVQGNKSKVLYQINGQAALHSQKIGNALRTIDTWHPHAAEVGAIAVDPYGAVTTSGEAYRQPKANMDFYKIFDRWTLKGEKPEVEQQHFVMAMLIRGGVFGG